MPLSHRSLKIDGIICDLNVDLAAWNLGFIFNSKRMEECESRSQSIPRLGCIVFFCLFAYAFFNSLK